MHLVDPKNTKCLNPNGRLSRDNERLFINRELSWIEFNHRVLYEAQDTSTALLDKVKFLGIISANVDEFYMKRLGGLKQKIASGNVSISIDGLTPSNQLAQCKQALRALQIEKESTYSDVYKQMELHNVCIRKYKTLSDKDKVIVDGIYLRQIEQHVVVDIIEPTKPFPFLSNLSLYLLVSAETNDSDLIQRSLIKIPSGCGITRFVKIPETFHFVLLEDIISAHIEKLLGNIQIVSIDLLRVTRSAVSYRDYKELDDQREMIEEELHDRKYASVVRLQVSPSMQPSLQYSVATSLGLDAKKDVFESIQLLRMSDLQEIASIDLPQLQEIPHKLKLNYELSGEASILEAIRLHSSIVLQHPYESFTQSVEKFVFEASHNADVISIKMTLYRTSVNTRIVDHLIDAALRGKKVSVVVELKARFDEASNLRWARRLERAGVHVNHGIAGLKTHCKFILVSKRDKDKLRRYVHVGTGNYHAGTAQQYADVGLLSCEEDVTSDISDLYNYLISSKPKPIQFRKILATPPIIKKSLMTKIQREIELHSTTDAGYICMKTNALEDPDITLALYRASRAGVTVKLIVRDICRLRPGVKGLSENISVVSIVGRFLEHSRLYHFGNGGNDEIYMGSADLMSRNLERRIELLIPIDDICSKQQLISILNLHLRDNCCSWAMQVDGTYKKNLPKTNEALINSQTSVRKVQQENLMRR